MTLRQDVPSWLLSLVLDASGSKNRVRLSVAERATRSGEYADGQASTRPLWGPTWPDVQHGADPQRNQQPVLRTFPLISSYPDRVP